MDKLRGLVIGQARQLRPAEAVEIERIGRSAGMRIADSRAVGRDTALGLTICRARVTWELPEGAADAFDGGRLLMADLRYGVQRSAGGEMLVHQLQGAEPLALRLAAIPLRTPPPLPMQAEPRPPAPKPSRTPAPLGKPRAQVDQRSPPLRRGMPEPALSFRGRPSFDCRRAGSRVERMVCGDERLAALDRVTASLYVRSLARVDRGTQVLLRQSQARFIERRDDCRRSGCVADRYRARLDEIDALVGR